jgi:hypothetical protein
MAGGTGSKNRYNEVHYRVSSNETIPPARHLLSAKVKVDKEGKFGTGGTVALRLGKESIGNDRFEKQVGGDSTANEGFDIGCDACSPVSELYELPLGFTGQII